MEKSISKQLVTRINQSETSKPTIDEMERQIKDSLSNIEENNEIIRRLERLSNKVVGVKLNRRASKKRRLKNSKLEVLIKQCGQVCLEYRMKACGFEQNEREKLYNECRVEVRQLCQQELNLSFNMEDENNCAIQLSDAMFYYLMKDEEPSHFIWTTMKAILDPLTTEVESWYECCCDMLFSEQIFLQFYTRLGGTTEALKHFFYIRPALLHQDVSYYFMSSLVKYLTFDELHMILEAIRDKDGRTHMFYAYIQPYVDMYSDHVDELYHILSIADNQGQTALYSSYMIHWLLIILAETYTPEYKSKFYELIYQRDNNGDSVFDVAEKDERDELLYLTHRVQNNRYLTTTNEPTILIIYNTNNRQKTEQEAHDLYDALVSFYRTKGIGHLFLECNKTKDETIELIQQTANQKLPDELHHSAFIVIMLSSGDFENLDDCEGKPISLSSIERAMCVNVLKRRPKILITQSYQEKWPQTNSHPRFHPTYHHFMSVMSGVPGQATGAFIKILTNEIRESFFDTNIVKLIAGHDDDYIDFYGDSIQLPHICKTFREQNLDTEGWLWWLSDDIIEEEMDYD